MKINRDVSHVEAPPIAEAMTWVEDKPRNRALINLCQAVPSYPPAEELAREVGRVALLPQTSLYTDILGLPVLREALAADMASDYGGIIAARNVAITAGCNQAFSVVMMALARSGDNVVLPVPYYFNHHMWLEMLGIAPRYLDAMVDGSALPDPDRAAALIDDRTRAIVLCTPNNPTGAIYPKAMIQRFHEVARRHGIALVVDETYKDFRTEPAPPHDLFADPEWEKSFIQLYSFSKAFALTGYRVGSIIAGERQLREIEKILDCVAICAPHIAQSAALFGLSHLSQWKRGKLELAQEKARALRHAFDLPGLDYRLISAGAFFAYVRHPFANEDARSLAKRLAKAHDLLSLPGSMFGPGQDAYLRLAFANADAALMPETVARLIESQNGS
jgi:aspartate/methionine/tyrosine aminotransferase